MKNFNLTSIKPFAKIGLIVLALLAGVILITIIFAIATQNKTTKNSPNPIPTFQPKKITQPAKFESELSKIKPLLPYSSQDYTIEFLAPINTINIKITAKSADEFLSIKKNAEGFIKQKGVSDICSLNIFWIPLIDMTTRKNLKATDYITSGCPIVPK